MGLAQKGNEEFMSKSLVLMFGLPFTCCTTQEAGALIIKAAKEKQKCLVVTPNVDHLVQMADDLEMQKVFQQARFCFADGMPLVWFSRLIRAPLPGRVTGADLLPEIAEQASTCGISVYFLGGLTGVAETASIKLQEKFSGLKVAGTYCPPFGFEHDQAECAKIVAKVNQSGADILFVGVGAPKQEKWAVAHMDQLDVGPILGVGASFDFASGMIKRAPVVFQKLGAEWFWRMIKEPGRLWKRYLLRDSRFIFMAFKEWMRIRSE